MVPTVERLGHRGTLDHENTLRGLRAALDAGLDGVEIDVMLSADDEVVVFHDVDLLRLAGDPRKVRASTWPELRALELRCGELIPSLREVLVMWPDDRVLNIELKAGGVSVAERVTEMTRGRRDVVLSSFVPAYLLAAGGDHPRALIVSEGSAPALVADGGRSVGCEWVHVEAPLATEAGVAAYGEAGLRVGIWGARSIEEEDACVARGVERVITDFVTPETRR
jgi:glycerophosphoryl diester phosphodiesterase